MSDHFARIRWTRTTDGFGFEEYNREHEWMFDEGTTVRGSAAPGYHGRPDHVDPEQAFIASLSSCHMLTFLAIASKKGFVVDGYEDAAKGVLGKTEDRKLAMTEVILRPEVKFSGDKQPTPEELERLHKSAHRNCFIANSVTTKVTVESTG